MLHNIATTAIKLKLKFRMISLQSLINTRKRSKDVSTPILKNWVEGTTPKVLEDIHQKQVNVSIYNRNIYHLEKEINTLLKNNITFDTKGTIDAILNELISQVKLEKSTLLVQDIHNLLQYFKDITKSKCFRLFLASVNTNMCRKFHMDFNVLRMLCTYSGPGTLWLSEDNLDRNALEAYGSNDCIVIDENLTKQAKTGSVMILKGAKYSKRSTRGAVHRSPTIEESSEQRLLLRIDML